MAHDRGLPAVPRGQSREITAYLQSLHNVILSMSGLGRGTSQTRAVRISERVYTGAGSATARKDFLDKGSVLTAHLANGAVTTEKIADKAVTGKKLAQSAIENFHIKPGAVDAAALGRGSVTETKLAYGSVTGEKITAQAVSTEKIADKAVTADKIAEGSIGFAQLAAEVRPQILSGTAGHGETVEIGKWLFPPLVFPTAVSSLPVDSCGIVDFGIGNLREEDGNWLFEARAVCEFEFGRYPGELGWSAFGWRQSDA